MLLSIIIVNYNTKTLTLACLKSIFDFLGASIPFEVIVVDNGSRDGSQEAIRAFAAARETATLIEANENLGFAKANNIGIKKASGKQVLLLNSDTYLVDDSLLRAVDYLERQPEIFGCGCTLLNADGSIGISYGKFPDLATVVLELLTWRTARLRAIVPRRSSAVYPIDFPCGAFFLIKRRLLDAIGLLDEQFFMYCEETDLAKRAWNAGYRIVHFGPARVVHVQGQSVLSDGSFNSHSDKPRDLEIIFYQSWKRYLCKHCFAVNVWLVGALLSLFFRANYLIFRLMKNEPACNQFAKELQALQRGFRIGVPS
jgi:GT2 family glycosyltransferase